MEEWHGERRAREFLYRQVGLVHGRHAYSRARLAKAAIRPQAAAPRSPPRSRSSADISKCSLFSTDCGSLISIYARRVDLLCVGERRKESHSEVSTLTQRTSSLQQPTPKSEPPQQPQETLPGDHRSSIERSIAGSHHSSVGPVLFSHCHLHMPCVGQRVHIIHRSVIKKIWSWLRAFSPGSQELRESRSVLYNLHVQHGG